ncbi:MAG TPA: FkbM family methyltransferase, partial [Longimicrobiales bacterium]|nr:FkbM family methyltransferase [Longimicrobiales bacterium]
MQLPYPVRAAGQRLLGGVPVRIRGGVNRGRAWSLACLGRGYGSGRFGRDRLEALAALVREGDVVWDVGAHKGFVALAASSMVGARGTVVAVEPAEVNLAFLRRHLAWNRLENVRVVDAALADAPGAAAFGGTGSSVAFRIGVGPATVRVETIERLVEAGLPP